MSERFNDKVFLAIDHYNGLILRVVAFLSKEAAEEQLRCWQTNTFVKEGHEYVIKEVEPL